MLSLARSAALCSRPDEPTQTCGAWGAQDSVSLQSSKALGSTFLRAAETTFAAMDSWMLLGLKAASTRPRGDCAAASQGLSLLFALSSPPAGWVGELQASW